MMHRQCLWNALDTLIAESLTEQQRSKLDALHRTPPNRTNVIDLAEWRSLREQAAPCPDNCALQRTFDFL